jgi:signal transduction histidine kinase
MHPILQGRLRLALYLAAWIPVLALLAYVARADGNVSWPRAMVLLAPSGVVFAFVCLSPWYVARVQPLRFSEWASLLSTWTAAALTAGLLLAGGAALAWYLAGRPWSRLGMLAAFGTVLYLLSAGLHYAIIGAEHSRAAEARAAEARSLARDAQLSALRMQINPHFLFNSLHSIAALTTADGARAREMCIRLSDFLRSSLGLRDRESIPMREELTLARNYLEVERVRFGHRLQVRDRIEPDCEDCAVPALLLQPLVENAVKHGALMRGSGGEITVRTQLDGSRLVCTVEDNGPGVSQEPTRPGAFGVLSVRRRLALRWAEAANLRVESTTAGTRWTVEVPAELGTPS